MNFFKLKNFPNPHSYKCYFETHFPGSYYPSLHDRLCTKFKASYLISCNCFRSFSLFSWQTLSYNRSISSFVFCTITTTEFPIFLFLLWTKTHKLVSVCCFFATLQTVCVCTVHRSDGNIADVYDQSPIMSTYQVCVIVGEFQYVEAEWEGVTSYPVNVAPRFQPWDW